MSPEIVVLDGYTENPGDLSWGELEKLGALKVYDRTSLIDEGEAIARIGGAEIVLTNKTPITRRVIDACPNVKFIAMLATGYNVVDAAYAKERGIPLSNVPAYGTASVSQFSIALLLELCHRIGLHDKTVHEGRWERCADFCYWETPQIELDGKTIGIIGFGRIGQREGAIARALGMKVLAYDLYPNDSGRRIAEYVELDALLAQSDAISLHCNLTSENVGLICRNTIAKMKDGVLIVNNARGQLVNEQDLADALNSGKVGGAALDVVSSEPIRGDNPLLSAKNCVITPHISWASLESRRRIMECTVSNVKAYLEGRPVNVVNGL